MKEMCSLCNKISHFSSVVQMRSGTCMKAHIVILGEL